MVLPLPGWLVRRRQVALDNPVRRLYGTAARGAVSQVSIIGG